MLAWLRTFHNYGCICKECRPFKNGPPLNPKYALAALKDQSEYIVNDIDIALVLLEGELEGRVIPKETCRVIARETIILIFQQHQTELQQYLDDHPPIVRARLSPSFAATTETLREYADRRIIETFSDNKA